MLKYYIIFAVVVVAIIVMFIIKAVKNNKLEIKIKNLEIKGKTRYTSEDKAINANGAQNLTYLKDDILLATGVLYKVNVKNGIKPGKYLLLSSNEKENAFNIRIGNYVKEYKHNSEIVLAENDEITAVNMPVILR